MKERDEWDIVMGILGLIGFKVFEMGFVWLLWIIYGWLLRDNLKLVLFISNLVICFCFGVIDFELFLFWWIFFSINVVWDIKFGGVDNLFIFLVFEYVWLFLIFIKNFIVIN